MLSNISVKGLSNLSGCLSDRPSPLSTSRLLCIASGICYLQKLQGNLVYHSRCDSPLTCVLSLTRGRRWRHTVRDCSCCARRCTPPCALPSSPGPGARLTLLLRYVAACDTPGAATVPSTSTCHRKSVFKPLCKCKLDRLPADFGAGPSPVAVRCSA